MNQQMQPPLLSLPAIAGVQWWQWSPTQMSHLKSVEEGGHGGGGE